METARVPRSKSLTVLELSEGHRLRLASAFLRLISLLLQNETTIFAKVSGIFFKYFSQKAQTHRTEQPKESSRLQFESGVMDEGVGLLWASSDALPDFHISFLLTVPLLKPSSVCVCLIELLVHFISTQTDSLTPPICPARCSRLQLGLNSQLRSKNVWTSEH